MIDKDRPVLLASVPRELWKKEAAERLKPRSIPVLNNCRSDRVVGDFVYLSVHAHKLRSHLGSGVGRSRDILYPLVTPTFSWKPGMRRN